MVFPDGARKHHVRFQQKLINSPDFSLPIEEKQYTYKYQYSK